MKDGRVESHFPHQRQELWIRFFTTGYEGGMGLDEAFNHALTAVGYFDDWVALDSGKPVDTQQDGGDDD